MVDYMEKSKCLASLALFRELYDSKNDIYGVLSEFLLDVITTNGKHQFNLTEITLLLNDIYDFDIPEAVVKTSLKRLDFLQKSQGVYCMTDTNKVKNVNNISQKYSETKDSNNYIINDLFVFIENSKKQKLNEEDKKQIVNSFCSYLLEETTQEYSQYISAYILHNKQNTNFTSSLNKIKEGVILYSGLKYHSNLNDLGSWNTDLTIFLETEILFSLAGYNGELYNVLFNDFYSFVKEINLYSRAKNNRPRIHLKYFEEVKVEIDNYFKMAEYIVTGKESLNPSKTAMSVIVDGCKSPSDVISKKIEFYKLLDTKGIKLDDNNSYYINNYEYNIESPEMIKKLESELKIENITRHLRFINYINIIRKGDSSNNFENIGCILLTGNSITLQIAWNGLIKHNGSVPLATTLNFLTNKFWFKLNKGFGKSNYPKSFDIITRAQIVMSSQINDSVANKYDELQKGYKTGQITEDNAKAIIIELRKQVKKPEELDETDIDDALCVITEASVERYVKEQEIFKNRAQKQAEENESLKKELFKREKENAEKEIELRKLREEKEKEDEIKKKRNRFLRKSVLIVGLLIFICLSVISYIYFNKLFGIITGLITIVSAIFAFFNIDSSKVKKFWIKK